MGGPVQLGALIQGLLERRGWQERYRRQLALEVWPECVGPEIARHAAAVGWQGDVLVVEVDHALWAQELAFLRARLCAALNRRLGARVVADIRFRTTGAGRRRASRARRGSQDAPPPGAAGAPAAAPGPRPLPGALAAAVEAVGDPELRESLRRCLQARFAASAAACRECGAPLPPASEGTFAASGEQSTDMACPACALEWRPGGLRERLRRYLEREPWLDAGSVDRLLPGAGQAVFAAVRESLRAEWSRRLRELLGAEGVEPNARAGRTGEARELALRYAMLVAGVPPSRLTHAHVYEVLGPLAERLFPPAGDPADDR